MTSHPIWTGYWGDQRHPALWCDRLAFDKRPKCGEMHHQNQHCSLSDRQRICCQGSRTRHGGFEYDSSKQQQKEDNDVAGTRECPSVCYYTGKAWDWDLGVIQLSWFHFKYRSKECPNHQFITVSVLIPLHVVGLWQFNFGVCMTHACPVHVMFVYVVVYCILSIDICFMSFCWFPSSISDFWFYDLSARQHERKTSSAAPYTISAWTLAHPG